VEIAGLLCLLLMGRALTVLVGPARIWCDGSDALHVVFEGHEDDLSWPSPVCIGNLETWPSRPQAIGTPQACGQ
jgi:hypothetical protein